MSGHKNTYTIDVVADSAAEAIAIAAEALPRNAKVVNEEAIAGDGTVWRVTLRYTGGSRRGGEMPG